MILNIGVHPHLINYCFGHQLLYWIDPEYVYCMPALDEERVLIYVPISPQQSTLLGIY